MKRKKLLRWLVFTGFPSFLLYRYVTGTLEAMRANVDGFSNEEMKSGEGFLDYKKEKVNVTVSDGTSITTTVFTPEGEGPFPLIIIVHSWIMWRIQADYLYAPGMAKRGYMVLTMDCRGWGSSGDAVFCADPEHELKDTSDLIDWITDPDSGFPVDPERIGITGVSYGGGFSFLMPCVDDRITAAVPMNGWTDLGRSLLPDGCWKHFWSYLLYGGAVWGMKRDFNGELTYWLKKVWNGDYDVIDERVDGRGAINSVDKIKCPMFIVHSWNDDLFQPNQILEFYEKLNVPKKMYITNGIHGFDGGRGDFLVPNRAWEKTRMFFDYWLKDMKDNGIMDEPAVEYYQPWDGRMEHAGSWPLPDTVEQKYFFRRLPQSGQHEGLLAGVKPDKSEPPEMLTNNTVSNFHTSGPPMLRWNVIFNIPIPGVPWSISGDSAMFETPPLEKDMEVVGTPAVDLYAVSSVTECQLNALLYDVSPSGFPRLITHGAAMNQGIEPGSVTKLQFQLVSCAHKIKAGHNLRIVICASDPLHVKPSSLPARYKLLHGEDYPSSVTMPVVVAGSAKKPVKAAEKPAKKPAKKAGKPAKAKAGKAAKKPAKKAGKPAKAKAAEKPAKEKKKSTR